MRSKRLIPLIFLATILILVTVALKAGNTGQIKGTIIDSKTGNPIVSASVLIVGTTHGAITDFDGKYTIRLVEPGMYNLRVTHLEFATVTIDSVIVKEGFTFEASAKLERKQVEFGNTISVIADRKIIDKFVTGSEVVISKEEIGRKPATSVDELLAQVAGVTKSGGGEVYIRGGRAGEVSYKVDGVPIGDPLGGLGQAGSQLNMIRIPPAVPAPTFPPSNGGNAVVNGQPYDAMFFQNHGVNPFVDTEDDNLSTFAIDVDDASYIMARSYLERGTLPPKDAVRTEEFINHFDYNYRSPSRKTFTVVMEGAKSKFGKNSQLLKIGIKGYEIDPAYRKTANLVFVVDVSGSMNRENRLALVKKSLHLLVGELNSSDRVGIVAYGSTGFVVLEPTSLSHRRRITRAIESLRVHGATNAEQGIRLGYEMANRMFDPSRINRVILCSDGVANVGQTGPDALLQQIKRYAQKGITLSTVGFGMGNYNDVLMEKLGNKGNGFYAYVDDLDQAHKIFVDNLTGNLQVIARDVKIQVEFDPTIVKSYRLLGYENRDVADRDFRNDQVDGGEIGAGHSVTALYEIKFYNNSPRGDFGKVQIRYKSPDLIAQFDDDDVYDPREYGEERVPISFATTVDEFSVPISSSVLNPKFAKTSPEFRLAACAAEFAEILRGSYWAKDASIDLLYNETRRVAREMGGEEINELMRLMEQARGLKMERAER